MKLCALMLALIFSVSLALAKEGEKSDITINSDELK